MHVSAILFLCSIEWVLTISFGNFLAVFDTNLLWGCGPICCNHLITVPLIHYNLMRKLCDAYYSVKILSGFDYMLPPAITADFQACIEDGTVSQIVRQRTPAATAALTLA